MIQKFSSRQATMYAVLASSFYMYNFCILGKKLNTKSHMMSYM